MKNSTKLCGLAVFTALLGIASAANAQPQWIKLFQSDPQPPSITSGNNATTSGNSGIGSTSAAWICGANLSFDPISGPPPTTTASYDCTNGTQTFVCTVSGLPNCDNLSGDAQLLCIAQLNQLEFATQQPTENEFNAGTVPDNCGPK
jgi:hypothetical protein